MTRASRHSRGRAARLAQRPRSGAGTTGNGLSVRKASTKVSSQTRSQAWSAEVARSSASRSSDRRHARASRHGRPHAAERRPRSTRPRSLEAARTAGSRPAGVTIAAGTAAGLPFGGPPSSAGTTATRAGPGTTAAPLSSAGATAGPRGTSGEIQGPLPPSSSVWASSVWARRSGGRAAIAFSFAAAESGDLAYSGAPESPPWDRPVPGPAGPVMRRPGTPSRGTPASAFSAAGGTQNGDRARSSVPCWLDESASARLSAPVPLRSRYEGTPVSADPVSKGASTSSSSGPEAPTSTRTLRRPGSLACARSATTSQPNDRRMRAVRVVSNRLGPAAGSARAGRGSRTARHGTHTNRSRSSAQPAAIGTPQAPAGNGSGLGSGRAPARGRAACLSRGAVRAVAVPAAGAPSSPPGSAGPMVVISSSGAPSPGESQPIARLPVAPRTGQAAPAAPAADGDPSGAVTLTTCHQGPIS